MSRPRGLLLGCTRSFGAGGVAVADVAPHPLDDDPSPITDAKTCICLVCMQPAPMQTFANMRPLVGNHPEPGEAFTPEMTMSEALAITCRGSGRIAPIRPHCPGCKAALPKWLWPTDDPYRLGEA